MARRVRSSDGATAAPSVWRDLKANFEARAARSVDVDWYSAPEPHSVQLVREMTARRPVIVAGWDLGQHRPDRRSGTRYRVYPSGLVEPVVARRDPADRMSIVGWDKVPPADD